MNVVVIRLRLCCRLDQNTSKQVFVTQGDNTSSLCLFLPHLVLLIDTEPLKQRWDLFWKAVVFYIFLEIERYRKIKTQAVWPSVCTFLGPEATV